MRIVAWARESRLSDIAAHVFPVPTAHAAMLLLVPLMKSKILPPSDIHSLSLYCSHLFFLFFSSLLVNTWCTSAVCFNLTGTAMCSHVLSCNFPTNNHIFDWLISMLWLTKYKQNSNNYSKEQNLRTVKHFIQLMLSSSVFLVFVKDDPSL